MFKQIKEKMMKEFLKKKGKQLINEFKNKAGEIDIDSLVEKYFDRLKDFDFSNIFNKADVVEFEDENNNIVVCVDSKRYFRMSFLDCPSGNSIIHCPEIDVNDTKIAVNKNILKIDVSEPLVFNNYVFDNFDHPYHFEKKGNKDILVFTCNRNIVDVEIKHKGNVGGDLIITFEDSKKPKFKTDL